MVLHINLPGYDDLKIELNDQGEIISYHLQTSKKTLELFEVCLKTYGPLIGKWSLDFSGLKDFNFSHNKITDASCDLSERRSYLLLRECILRARGEWNLPFENEIVCVCRQILAETIDQSVVAGALNPEEISHWTTASTACTSCKPKLSEFIKWRHQT